MAVVKLAYCYPNNRDLYLLVNFLILHAPYYENDTIKLNGRI